MDIHLPIIAGLSIGFLSSLHCVGMCGAIAFALPIHYLPKHLQWFGMIVYHFGRVFTYSILGFLFGNIGRLFFIGGIQQLMSISLGIIVLMVLGLSYFKTKHKKKQTSFLQKLQLAIQNMITQQIQKKQVLGMFVVGSLNGLLPCGLVYFALTGAMAIGSIFSSTLFMTGFGLGTLPAMILFTYFGYKINIQVRNIFKQSVPFIMATMAILLIVRGLNLNIPFLSPVLINMAEKTIPCH
ncbi:MAG: sulfite exporter TauE/SafE family protein [Chitinophagaceae bacterium]